MPARCGGELQGISVHGFAKETDRHVGIDELDRVVDSGDFLQAALHASSELVTRLRAILQQVSQEFLVHARLILRVFELSRSLRVLLAELRVLNVLVSASPSSSSAMLDGPLDVDAVPLVVDVEVHGLRGQLRVHSGRNIT